MLYHTRFILLITLLIGSGIAQGSPLHHTLSVSIDPSAGTLKAEDTIRLPENPGRIVFELHQGLAPQLHSGGRLRRLGRQGHLERYALYTDAGTEEITLSYGGRIRHRLQEVSESLGRSHQRSIGTIQPDGVFLSAYSGWYPWVAGQLQSFELRVELPEGWMAVSQGSGPAIEQSDASHIVRWRESRPQDDIYLIAARFELYRRDTATAQAQVYLRRADPALAQRYLRATEDYLNLYSRLIGDYPYDKFALVENFWATGYGMPSFTLLGSQVIRLPFILHTSYPHEILHNWWGNGVYVDYAQGNWSEGLTTYLADHLLKERRGQGAAYRRDALQRYADHVDEGKDFPLREFRARHGSASQSVGYGKGFMLFHMLRRELGDSAFLQGLRRFYRDHRYRSAGYKELRQAFEKTAGRDLSGYFEQWLSRTGAPSLSIGEVRVTPTDAGYRLTARLRQTQDQPVFDLRVPVVVSMADGRLTEQQIALTERDAQFEIITPAKPVRIDVDPRFDLFRHLYPEESPPTLGALFGSDSGLIVLPGAADAQRLGYYTSLAQDWSRNHPDWEIRLDSDLRRLPTDRPVWLLGWGNRFRSALAQRLREMQASVTGSELTLNGEHFASDQHSGVLVAPGATSQQPPMAWLGAQSPQAIPGLARKLPHYGKYAWLVFTGKGPKNIRKGQWPVRHSPLSVTLDDGAQHKPLPPLPALTRLLD